MQFRDKRATKAKLVNEIFHYSCKSLELCNVKELCSLRAPPLGRRAEVHPTKSGLPTALEVPFKTALSNKNTYISFAFFS